MKKYAISIMLTAIIMLGFNQRLNAGCQDHMKEGNPDTSAKTSKVIIVKDRISGDETDLSFENQSGKQGLNLLESLEEGKIDIETYDIVNNRYQDSKERASARKRNRFKGHWTGVELGFNNYVTSENSLSLPPSIDYLTLHSGKSGNFNINFAQLSLGLFSHFGVVTGLGITWNNYRFDGNNNIQKGDNGIIEKLDPGDLLKKSKLTTVFLDLPVLLELQIPADNHHLNIAVGPIGAIKIGSHNKMVFENGEKVKGNGDFSLNVLRLGATARVGYQNFQIYGTYYRTPLVQPDKSPGGYNLYPCEIGIALTFND